MSHDIRIIDAGTSETIEFPDRHFIRGGTYAPNGTHLAELNITYNYSNFFRDLFGEGGIRRLYGMTIKDSIPVLMEARDKLNGNPGADYWIATEYNVRKALTNMLLLAVMAPQDSVWAGD